LPCSKRVVCAYVDDAYSFVGFDQYGIKCLTCKYDTHNCVHAAFVQAKLDQDDESYLFLHDVFACMVAHRPPSIPVCLSKQKIDFTGSIVSSLQVIQSIKSLLSANDDGIFNILPNDAGCGSKCSSCDSSKENKQMVSNIKLYLFNETIVCNGKQTVIIQNCKWSVW
jgi:hypothetical protein